MIFRLTTCAIIAVSCLMAGPNLIMAAETGWESLQGLLVSFLGLGFAVLFSCIWAEDLDLRDRRARRADHRRPY